jgi:hypothetical protein
MMMILELGTAEAVPYIRRAKEAMKKSRFLHRLFSRANQRQ